MNDSLYICGMVTSMHEAFYIAGFHFVAIRGTGCVAARTLSWAESILLSLETPSPTKLLIKIPVGVHPTESVELTINVILSDSRRQNFQDIGNIPPASWIIQRYC